MQRILKYLLSNYVLAIVFATVLYFFYPISKYDWLIRTSNSNGKDVVMYLNASDDEKSEYVSISDNNNTFGSVSLYSTDDLLLNLTNLPLNIFIDGKGKLLIDDIDNNNQDELVFLGEKSDSLFLITLEYKNHSDYQPIFNFYFLDLIKKFQGNYQLETKIAIEDVDADGQKEIIVSVSSGFSILPRRVYLVNPFQNKILKSPISGAVIKDFTIVDDQNDGFKEIILNTQAYCNIDEEKFDDTSAIDGTHDSLMFAEKENLLKYNDCSAWIMVLDHHLEFLFDPIEIEGWTGSVYSDIFEFKNQQNILSIYSNFKDSLKTPKILIHSFNGQLKKEMPLSIDDGLSTPLMILPKIDRENNEVFFENSKKQVFKINDKLEYEPCSTNSCALDATNFIHSQINNEKIIVSFDKDLLKIYDSNYELQKTENLAGLNTDYCYISVNKISKEEEILMMDIGAIKVQLKIQKNSFYFYRYFIWVLITILIWIGLALIKQFFSYRAIKEKNKLEELVRIRTEEVKLQKDDLKKLSEDLKEKNDKVFQQNVEIEKRKREIEELYKKQTSSITYGKGIKDALLPSIKEIKDNFQEAFVFFKPQNVIGGDFYLTYNFNNRKVVIIGDASGESISGGFLSLLAINLLNNMKMDESTKASTILKNINAALYKHLSLYLREEEDGISMAVVLIDKSQEDLFDVQFASANIPMHYFSSNSVMNLKTLEPNDFIIRADVNQLSFEDKYIQLPKDSMIYLATKGFYNQENYEFEPYGKFQSRINFLRINVLPEQKQLELLVDHFNKWQGAQEQNDDVLCLGLRL